MAVLTYSTDTLDITRNLWDYVSEQASVVAETETDVYGMLYREARISHELNLLNIMGSVSKAARDFFYNRGLPSPDSDGAKSYLVSFDNGEKWFINAQWLIMADR